MITFSVVVFFIALGLVFYITHTPAKSAIITPIINGAVSQQSFISSKSILKVAWESGWTNFIRNILALIGIGSILGWFI